MNVPDLRVTWSHTYTSDDIIEVPGFSVSLPSLSAGVYVQVQLKDNGDRLHLKASTSCKATCNVVWPQLNDIVWLQTLKTIVKEWIQLPYIIESFRLLKFSYCWCGAYLDAARWRDLNTVRCFISLGHVLSIKTSQFSFYSHVLVYSIYTVLVTYE